MKVQTGATRALINTSSKIAQIARSRPIPFDVPRERYERGAGSPFYVLLASRNTRYDDIWRVYARYTHARPVTYTSARSEPVSRYGARERRKMTDEGEEDERSRRK